MTKDQATKLKHEISPNHTLATALAVAATITGARKDYSDEHLALILQYRNQILDRLNDLDHVLTR